MSMTRVNIFCFQILMKVLLLIVIAVTPSWQQWPCGDVYITEDKDCECGNTTITRVDYKRCCGTVQCVIEEDGRGMSIYIHIHISSY